MLSPRAANVPALLARFASERIALRLVAPRRDSARGASRARRRAADARRAVAYAARV
jgi:hypothetical protein